MKDQNEITFLRTYKDFIYYFNMLECNIAYCLRYCLKHNAKETPDKWLSVSFDSKIRKTLHLAKNVGVEDVFSKWDSDIQACRHLRNIIAHGSWEWRDYSDKPIMYHASEIKDGEGRFSNDEFKSKLTYLIEVSETFSKIRKQLEAACWKQDQQTSEM